MKAGTNSNAESQHAYIYKARLCVCEVDVFLRETLKDYSTIL